jgi:hypothetical protein
LALIGIVATLVIGWQVAAFGVVEQSGFQDDDGNLVVDPAPALGTTDWNSFDNPNIVWEGTAPNRSADVEDAGGTGWHFVGQEDATATNSDDGFAGGTKQDDDCATVSGSRAPNKDDLERAYLATQVIDGDTFLNLAWVRIPQNSTSASAHIGFEFNQGDTPCGSGGLVERTEGDLLIVYDFAGGTADPVITLRQWVTDPDATCEVSSSEPPCWGPSVNLTDAGFAEAEVNTSAVGSVLDTVAPSNDTLGIVEFGEAGINLSDALPDIFGPGQCNTFGQAEVISRSSGNSAQAQMKDLLGPVDFTLSNCGIINIIKHTDPRGLDQEFGFTATPNFVGDDLDCSQTTAAGVTPVETPTDFSLNDAGNAGPPPTDNAANTQACTGVPVGTYTFTEDDPTADNFALSEITCDPAASAETSVPNRTAEITIAAGDEVTCTFTNALQQGALAIEKDSTKGGAVSNPGALFTFDGQTVRDNDDPTAGTVSDEDPAVGRVCVSGLDLGDYTVNETEPPPGYGPAPAAQADQLVTVVNNTDCTEANYPTTAVANFTNAPLADIQVNFRDGGSGETSLTANGITCTGLTETSTTPPTGWDDSKTFEDLAIDPSPRTIECTIEIDP